MGHRKRDSRKTKEGNQVAPSVTRSNLKLSGTDPQWERICDEDRFAMRTDLLWGRIHDEDGVAIRTDPWRGRIRSKFQADGSGDARGFLASSTHFGTTPNTLMLELNQYKKDVTLLRSRRFWYRWITEIESVPTTPISSRTEQYKVGSWPVFDPVVIHRYGHSPVHRAPEVW